MVPTSTRDARDHASAMGGAKAMEAPGASPKLAYHANCWGPLGGDAVGVTSVSRLTYRTFADMGRAIAEIGAAGYEGVELFDGNVLDYQGRYADLRHILAGAGVRLVAVYSGANFI